jgi:hypothetical protein
MGVGEKKRKKKYSPTGNGRLGGDQSMVSSKAVPPCMEIGMGKKSGKGQEEEEEDGSPDIHRIWN